MSILNGERKGFRNIIEIFSHETPIRYKGGLVLSLHLTERSFVSPKGRHIKLYAHAMMYDLLLN